MKTIISASRRTDIPAFFYNELQHALKEKQITLANPLYPEKTYTVDLSPENIHSIILWSKDMSNVVRDPGYLQDYNLYFQYTITGYNKKVEPLVPDYTESIKTLEKLLQKYPSEAFNIRFDPIFIANDVERFPTANPIDGRLKAFETLCRDMKNLHMDNSRITISYLTNYRDTLLRMHKHGINVKMLTPTEEHELFQNLASISTSYGYDIYTCANDRFIDIPGIKKGHCIDNNVLTSLYGKCTSSKDKAQREQCGCVKSRDIGAYMPCKHACRYCYANPN